jgi:hypothetical protein
MYTEHDTTPAFEKFYLPFGGHLNGNNRWVKLTDIIPWDDVEQKYKECFAKKKGRKAKSVRVALGALIIKEKLNLSDEETVEQIRENPYLQYFLGFEGYRDTKPFEASMMTHFRKRLGGDVIGQINELIVVRYQRKKEDDERKAEEEQRGKGGGGTGCGGNRGQLVLDATCAPQDIRHPHDLTLLNEAREKTETIIDRLHAASGGEKKPRTYRRVAKKRYLEFMRGRKRNKRAVRKALRQQIGYVRRNLKTIETMLAGFEENPLSERQKRELTVITEVLRQQLYLYKNDTHSIPHKIVSISQPHVRPIARGKARGMFEFGAKISASVTEDRMVIIDRMSWEPYNESEDLKVQVENYRARSGHYPASVHADKIYRTRENLRYCAERGIRISGPKLGRPYKDSDANKDKLRALKRIMKRDEAIRQEVESVFGVGKRRYGLDRIVAKTKATSESMIMLCVLVMNLDTILRDLFLRFFGFAYCYRKISSWVHQTITECAHWACRLFADGENHLKYA